MEVASLQRALQQLLTTNMVVMTTEQHGTSPESLYEVSDLARTYLAKRHRTTAEEFRFLGT